MNPDGPASWIVDTVGPNTPLRLKADGLRHVTRQTGVTRPEVPSQTTLFRLWYVDVSRHSRAVAVWKSLGAPRCQSEGESYFR
jgi:hypothetical protein